jgi:hypothetical protein
MFVQMAAVACLWIEPKPITYNGTQRHSNLAKYGIYDLKVKCLKQRPSSLLYSGAHRNHGTDNPPPLKLIEKGDYVKYSSSSFHCLLVFYWLQCSACLSWREILHAMVKSISDTSEKSRKEAEIFRRGETGKIVETPFAIETWKDYKIWNSCLSLVNRRRWRYLLHTCGSAHYWRALADALATRSTPICKGCRFPMLIDTHSTRTRKQTCKR